MFNFITFCSAEYGETQWLIGLAGHLKSPRKKDPMDPFCFLENSKILYHFVFVSATDFKNHQKNGTLDT